MTDNIKLKFEDMDIRIERTFALDEAVVLERMPRNDNLLVTKVRVISHSWHSGGFPDEWHVYGTVLKKDGTPDERHGGAAWHRLWKPSVDGEPDHRAPFMRALDALDEQKN